MKNWIDFVKTNSTSMLKQGYLWLPRMVVNEMFTENATTCYQARIFGALLIKANYSTGYTLFRKRKVDCGVGELVTGVNELAIQTDVPSYRVHRILSQLQDNDLIEMYSCFHGRFIKVNNYKLLTSPAMEKSTSTQTTPSVPDSHKKQLEENRRIMEEVRKHK